MDLKTAIRYVVQYRRNGKSCYIRSGDRYDQTFSTNKGIIYFVCCKCRYNHGGKSKWWRAYLRFQDGKAIPSRKFSQLQEI